MPVVLIEDIAKIMGEDPADLTDLEKRKYCILIDWALTLATINEVKEPYTPNLKVIELPQEQCRKIIKAITKALKAGKFSNLDQLKPETELMDEMFEILCGYLSVDQGIADKVDLGFIDEYVKAIEKKGYVYTQSLTYGPKLNQQSSDIINANSKLKKAYDKLKNEKVFTREIEEFFVEKNKMAGINNIQSLAANKKSTEAHAADLVVFYLELIKALQTIKQNQNVNYSDEDMRALINHITPLIDKIKPILANSAVLLEIQNLLQEVLPRDKKDNNRPKIATMMSKMMVNHDQLRNFKTLDSMPEKVAIDRVILIGSEDLADDEVMHSLKMLLKNHSKEKIIVTFDVNDVKKVNERNKAENHTFTLQAIGHGSLSASKQLNANIGPYRGNASKVGDDVAALVNECPLINHVRITGCFSGLMRDDADLQTMQEKQHVKIIESKEHRRTLTMVIDVDLKDENCPFVEGTVAISCWNGIKKENRAISMTVSPGIIEPDKELGRMMWKPTSNTPKGNEGIKEVCLSTASGPKNKLRM